MTTGSPVGFIGIGRLGLPLASRLLDSGQAVVCCRRGRSDELIAKGATIAGDGSARAVAQAAEVVFTCLTAEALEPVIAGEDGLLDAGGTAPLVVELSTAPTRQKARLREMLSERGGELLDCPVSGTPDMAAGGRAVVFASGDRAAYERVAALLAAISPGATYVGELGAGTKMKYVANLLATVHATVAAEAIAFAATIGLDLDTVVEVISRSPGATSGQFNARAPMMAAEQFDKKLVTVAETRVVLDQIMEVANESGASVPMVTTAKALFDEFADQGEDDSEPAKISLFLRGRGTGTMAAAAEQTESTDNASLERT